MLYHVAEAQDALNIEEATAARVVEPVRQMLNHDIRILHLQNLQSPSGGLEQRVEELSSSPLSVDDSKPRRPG